MSSAKKQRTLGNFCLTPTTTVKGTLSYSRQSSIPRADGKLLELLRS